MTEKSVSRREFLRIAGLAGATIGLGAGLGGVLAACGEEETTTTAAGETTTTAAGETTTTAAGETTTTAAGTTVSLITKPGELLIHQYTTMDNDYYKTWQMGAEQVNEGLGLAYQADLNEGSPETQVSQFETGVSKGCRMFAITAPDPANIPRLAQIANDNQVYLVNTWEQPDWWTPFDAGDYYVSYFIPQSIDAGYITAKRLFDEMGGKGNFCHLTGWPGATADWQRTVGVDQAMKEYPDIVLLDRKPGKWNRNDSQVVVEDWITRFGDDIQGVFGQNDDEGIGAMNALEAAGRTGVPVTGVDGNKETMDLISAGRYTAAYTSYPFWQAGHGAVVSFDRANGWVPSPLERMMWTGGLLIDKGNVQAYLDKFFAPDKLPLDWKLMSRVLHPDDWDPQNWMAPIDMDIMWGPQPKPDNFTYPPEYVKAKESGEFETITQLYKDHYKRPIM